MKTEKLDLDSFIVKPGQKISLSDYDPATTAPYTDKKSAIHQLHKDVEQIAKMQNILYAQNSHAVLIILQGMDTAGKDGVIRHVMSGVNPQGTDVHSFKQPSVEELDHDYLWRNVKALPARGAIGIFNRSYYEEVVIARVHPKILDGQKIPTELKSKNIWKNRFDDINHFEKYLARNGVVILKFFLHLSKAEQKKRLLTRMEHPKKNWKFSMADVHEREFWAHYTEAYEQALSHTSTEQALWHIIPADNKWVTRTAIAELIVQKLKSLQLDFPKLSEKQIQEMAEGKAKLEAEESE